MMKITKGYCYINSEFDVTLVIYVYGFLKYVIGVGTYLRAI